MRRPGTFSLCGQSSLGERSYIAGQVLPWGAIPIVQFSNIIKHIAKSVYIVIAKRQFGVEEFWWRRCARCTRRKGTVSACAGH